MIEAIIRWSVANRFLVVLLSLHLSFGLRVLAIEFLPWPGPLKRLIAAGAGASLLLGAAFLMSAA